MKSFLYWVKILRNFEIISHIGTFNNLINSLFDIYIFQVFIFTYYKTNRKKITWNIWMWN